MEHLNKQHIILLGAFVSFVTSIATAVFTVSLMSQMPQGVAQTVTNVVEKTIERVVTVPADISKSISNKPITVEVKEQLVEAAKVADLSIVGIYRAGNNKVTTKRANIIATNAATPGATGSTSATSTASITLDSGSDTASALGALSLDLPIDGDPLVFGTIVSTDGYIAVSSDRLSLRTNLVAVFADGKRASIESVSDSDGNSSINLIFLKVKELPSAIKKNFDSMSKTGDVSLGQTLFILKKFPESALLQGNVQSVRSSDGVVVVNGIAEQSVANGAPVFNIKGEVIALNVANSESLESDSTSLYFPIKFVYSLLQKIK